MKWIELESHTDSVSRNGIPCYPGTTKGMNTPVGVIVQITVNPGSGESIVVVTFVPGVQVNEAGQFVKLQGELVR